MKITILTLFPEMIRPFLVGSIIGRARQRGIVEIEILDFRVFSKDRHRTVDQAPYGGGAGMVLMVEPIVKGLRSLDLSGVTSTRVILTSAAGALHTQDKAKELAELEHLVLIAGHYEGVDDRIRAYIDEELSIGDFVMTGGEIAAAAIADSVVRLLPGVLAKEGAKEQESFFTVSLKELRKAVGPDAFLDRLARESRVKGIHERDVQVRLLEYPHYTRPEVYEGRRVPEILLSGHHRKIHLWRLAQAYHRTRDRRPDLLDTRA